ncbi:MAG: 2-dehydropantoate 2-reductase [Alphaproteobacteria bacterium]|nr:2-dehydropantoate 2-reductase [Alphaproteobacteria bacterium]MBV9370646.1 2-dehydropantoate 2-reductase [Alphaproteobacteria bacterium]MBV9899990.1 2-dehydropantoate 2-reductase [Alphaproteobacteria bacterium]
MAGMRVAIFGAGSVGCFVGGAWAAAGVPVAFVGREAIGRDVAAHGLTLTDHTGWRARLAPDQVNFATRPFALAGADVIALCVKSPATAAAAREIARNAKSGAVVISFQNGVSNAETLRTLLKGRFPVAQAMVPFNVAYLGDGRFHKGVAGELVVEDLPVTRALAEAVGAGPAALRLAADMPAIAWGKLLINLNNAVNALSGRTLLDQLRERDYRRVVAASIVEALDVLQTAGIEPAKIGPVPPRLLPHVIASPNLVFNNLFLRIQKIDAKARSSMYDDLAAGRETEVDYLNGEVVRLGARVGRPTPVNARIVSLIKQREAGVEHLWTPALLLEHVLEGTRVAPGFGY